MEPDPSCFRWQLRVHQLLDRFDQDHYLLVMASNLSLQFDNLSRKFFVPGDHLSKPDKGSDNKYADLNRLRRINTLATMIAPCSVKAKGLTGDNFRF
jgi:hypothetical protein